MVQSPLWRRFLATTIQNDLEVPRPPLVLHLEHLKLLAAAGKLDGGIGEGSDRHVVKGEVLKVVSKGEEFKGELLEQRDLDRRVVSIKILNRGGEICELT